MDKNITCHEWISDYFKDPHRNLTLAEVNEKLVIRLLGGISLVSILIFIGLVGNVHVLYIYTRRFKRKSNYRIFVIFLSMLDVFNLAVSAPMVIYYLVHPVIFPSDSFCKIFRFVMYFANASSTCALVAIAVDRGRKTSPLWKNITQTQAKIMCVISLIVALLLSWPTFILFGVANVPTGVADLYGYRCLAEDLDPLYMTSFLICQTAFFFLVSLSLGILYGQIGMKIRKYGIMKRASTYSRRGSDNADRQVSRSTCTLVIVTLVYIFSSLPHHILAQMYFISDNFDCELTLPVAIAYYTFIFSCYFNNAVNPFIYGFRDKTFWKEMKKLYIRV